MAVVPLARHRHRPKKPPPFGLRVPRSPAWPPYQYITVPGQAPSHQKMTWWHFFNGIINFFSSFLPANEQDIRDVSQMLTTKIVALGNVVEEDLRSAYNSNLDYSHAILQFTEDVGRTAQAELARLSADIQALNHRESKHFHTLGQEIKHNRHYAQVYTDKARAYAIYHAVADSRAYVTKVWGKKIDANYAWLKNRDVWFKDKVSKWWKVIYRRQIVQIKNAANGWRLPFAGIWGAIHGSINPTVKIVAKAGDWMKWFAHWKRDALLAFGTLKAGEVAAWLEEKYVGGHK